MHMVQLRWSRVPIYTNCEGDDVDLEGDDDGDVVIDDEYGTSPHAKGVPLMMTLPISLGIGLGAGWSAFFQKRRGLSHPPLSDNIT
jgi:hypothetical protein